MSHKILIELDDSEYEFLKAQAEFPELRASVAVQRRRHDLENDYLEFARGF